jgi:hypothetical protein
VCCFVLLLFFSVFLIDDKKYDKQEQQGRAAFNERNTQTIYQQESVARSPGGLQTKTGQGKRQSMGRLITRNIHKKK